MPTLSLVALRRLIRTGTPVLGVYYQDGRWVTGRLQRIQKQLTAPSSSVAWFAQPWGSKTWRHLKSPRHIWVDWPIEDTETP